MNFENKQKIKFDKIICIICNQQLDKTELQHKCDSRGGTGSIHLNTLKQKNNTIKN
jgi:hypothetical protein